MKEMKVLFQYYSKAGVFEKQHHVCSLCHARFPEYLRFSIESFEGAHHIIQERQIIKVVSGVCSLHLKGMK